MKLHMIRSIFLFLFMVLFSCSTIPLGQHENLTNFITDKKYTIGKTKNGTTYYVRANPNSGEKITVALILKVGSVLEKNTQRGLAHFVEHMGFNGSVKFPDNEVSKILERHGVRFVEDLNAWTGYDETVFHITIPSEKSALLPLLLDIIEEWAHNLTFTQEEIEKERGVVQEEIRAMLQPYQRAYMDAFAFLLEGSQYAKREPGGAMKIIESAPHSVIKSFYDTWYKPNLMSIAIFGDIDVSEVEKEVLRRFRYEDTIIERPEYPLPIVESNEVEFTSFPIDEKTELPLGYIAQFRPAHTNYRENIIDTVLSFAVNRKLSLIAEKSTKLNYVSMGTMFLGTQGKHVTIFFFEPHKNKSYAAFEEVITELENLKQNGLSEDEYETLISIIIEKLENTEKSNDAFLDKVVDNFVHGQALEDDRKVISIFKNMMRGKFITRDEINTRLARIGKNFKTRIALIHPSRETIPDAQKFIAFYKNASTLPSIEKIPIEKIETLLSKNDKKRITRGSVVKQSYDKNSDLHTLVLHNGVTVYFKQLQTTDDIFIIGSAENEPLMKYGTTKKDVLNTDFAFNVLSYAKIGGYDAEQIHEYLRNTIDIDFSYGKKRIISTSVTRDTLETAFEFLHVMFRDIAYDPTKIDMITHTVQATIHQLFADDSFYLFTEYNNAMFPDNPFILDIEDYKATYFNAKKAFDIGYEAFDNIGDYTFYIAGNTNIQTIKKIFSTYIASLPTKDKKKDTRLRYDVGLTKKSKTHIEYKRGKAQTRVVYGWTKQWSKPTFDLRDKIIQDFIASILTTEMMEKIREEESAVYTIDASFDFDSIPKAVINLQISFDSAVDTSLDIIEKSKAIITQLSHGEIDKDIIERSRLGLKTLFQEITNDAYSYAHAIQSIKEDFDMDNMTATIDILGTEILTSLTYEDVSEYLKDFLQNAKYVQVIQNPQ